MLANDEKIFSIFEAHTELIKRGKQPLSIQYGHNVLVIEAADGHVVQIPRWQSWAQAAKAKLDWVNMLLACRSTPQ
jgi:hypothetical protein